MAKMPTIDGRGSLPALSADDFPCRMLVKAHVTNEAGEKLPFQGTLLLPAELGLLPDNIRDAAVKGIRVEAQNRLRVKKEAELGLTKTAGGVTKSKLVASEDLDNIEEIV